jgi:hypothetical protein
LLKNQENSKNISLPPVTHFTPKSLKTPQKLIFNPQIPNNSKSQVTPKKFFCAGILKKSQNGLKRAKMQ